MPIIAGSMGFSKKEIFTRLEGLRMVVDTVFVLITTETISPLVVSLYIISPSPMAFFFAFGLCL